MTQAFIQEPARRIPVLASCDVLVIGGGTAGVIAAVAAARQGAETILVERTGALGGLLTVGMNTKPSGRILGGIGLEFWRRAQAEGFAGKNITLVMNDQGRSMEISSGCDAERLKFLAARMCGEAGVKVLFECLAAAPVMDGNAVSGVVIEGKGGRQAVAAKAVVDCSADADIAAAAGAPFELGKNGAMQPVSMFFKLAQVDLRSVIRWVKEHQDDIARQVINEENPEYAFLASGFTQTLRSYLREHGGTLPRETVTLKNGPGECEVYCNNTRVNHVSGLDVTAASAAVPELYRQMELTARFLKERIPGFEKSYISGIAPALGVRETRHIRGGHTMSEAEALGDGRFADSVGVDMSAVDHHAVAGGAVSFRDYPPYEIPYRALVPQDVEQILVAGRTISAEHGAHSRTRTIPPAMTTGQAAGLAAALAVKSGRNVRDIDVEELQRMIRAENMPVFVSELAE